MKSYKHIIDGKEYKSIIIVFIHTYIQMENNEKKYDIKPMTVGIRAKYQEIIAEWSVIDNDWKVNMSIKWVGKAQMYLVGACTWLSNEDIENMDTQVFDSILAEIEKKKQNTVQETKKS